MPRLVRLSWNGRVHHAIEYRQPSILSVHLGHKLDEREISDAEATQGIDRLARRYFPEPMEASNYHGA